MSSWSTWKTNVRSDASGCLSGRRGEGDEGMVTVFVALSFTVILMFAALVLDGGIGYQSHRQSQNAADAGAMAGARALDHVRFYPDCSTGVTPCTNFTGSADIRAEVLRQARNTGADFAGISCWFTKTDFTRGIEFCNTVTLPDNASLAQYSGVEVSARVTKTTNFAKTAGFNQTTATTTAKAFLYDFGGGTGSPFIVCGTLNYWDRVAQPNSEDFGYPMLNSYPNGDGTFTYTGVNAAAVNKYYLLQASQIPTCGNNTSSFKGKGGQTAVGAIPTWSDANNGNGQSAQIQVDVAGVKACPPNLNTQVVDGCGMVLPIAEKYDPATAQYHIVSWLAFQVWGAGTGNYDFSNVPSPPPSGHGNSCVDPFGPRNPMKYCGKLLGAVTITGGIVTRAATSGSLHTIRIIE